MKKSQRIQGLIKMITQNESVRKGGKGGSDMM